MKLNWIRSFFIFAPLMIAWNSAQADTALEQIRRTKTLRVASDPIVPPIADCDTTGKCSGFEIDLLKVICQELGPEVQLRWVKVKWDQIPQTVKAGEADIGLNAIFAPHPKANEVQDETHPPTEGDWGVYSLGYYRTGIAVAYHAKDKKVTFESIKSSGAIVSAIDDPVAVKTMREFGFKVKTYDADDAHLTAFAEHKVKYVAYDYPILKKFVSDSKGRFLLIPGLLPKSEQDYSALLHRKNPDLLKLVNDGIRKWLASPDRLRQLQSYGLEQ